MPRYCKGLTTGDDSTSLQQFLSIVGWVKVEPLSLTRNFLAFMGFKLFQLHIIIKYIHDQLFTSDDWFFLFFLIYTLCFWKPNLMYSWEPDL